MEPENIDPKSENPDDLPPEVLADLGATQAEEEEGSNEDEGPEEKPWLPDPLAGGEEQETHPSELTEGEAAQMAPVESASDEAMATAQGQMYDLVVLKAQLAKLLEEGRASGIPALAAIKTATEALNQAVAKTPGLNKLRAHAQEALDPLNLGPAMQGFEDVTKEGLETLFEAQQLLESLP